MRDFGRRGKDIHKEYIVTGWEVDEGFRTEDGMARVSARNTS